MADDDEVVISNGAVDDEQFTSKPYPYQVFDAVSDICYSRLP